jgi:hypothetical protein
MLRPGLKTFGFNFFSIPPSAYRVGTSLMQLGVTLFKKITAVQDLNGKIGLRLFSFYQQSKKKPLFHQFLSDTPLFVWSRRKTGLIGEGAPIKRRKAAWSQERGPPALEASRD